MYGDSRTRSRLTVCHASPASRVLGIGAMPDFVGRPASDVRIAFVPTGGVPCDDASVIDADLDRLRELRYAVTDLDLVGIGRDQLSDAGSSSGGS